MKPIHFLPLILLLAGCADDAATGPTEDAASPTPTPSPAPPAATPGPPAPPEPKAWEVRDDARGCTEQAIVLLVGMETARSVLPEGFEPADAASLLDLPAPTGQSAAFIDAAACIGTSSATLAVPVEPREGAVDDAFYMLGYATSNASLVERLRAAGVPAFQAETFSRLGASLMAGEGHGAVSGAPEMAYTFAGVVGPEQEGPRTARFWHVGPNGTLQAEYGYGSPVRKGSMSECRFDEASLVTAWTGVDDCEGQTTAFLAFPDRLREGTMRFTPAE